MITRYDTVPVWLAGLLVAALWQIEIIPMVDRYYLPFYALSLDKWLARDAWYAVIVACFMTLWWWGRRQRR